MYRNFIAAAFLISIFSVNAMSEYSFEYGWGSADKQRELEIRQSGRHRTRLDATGFKGLLTSKGVSDAAVRYITDKSTDFYGHFGDYVRREILATAVSRSGIVAVAIRKYSHATRQTPNGDYGTLRDTVELSCFNSATFRQGSCDETMDSHYIIASMWSDAQRMGIRTITGLSFDAHNKLEVACVTESGENSTLTYEEAEFIPEER